ncbi:anti-sigma factor [Alcaligenaceae bacterium CGII-47]|nr:anti-sigma factor [Alcaligenaceae bacterium CGII-47]
MKPTPDIDQDRRIAEYVLGLSPISDVSRIQDMLSRHDPAAACALKWEAYLLGICDSMVPIAPPPNLFDQIQDALGHQKPNQAPAPVPTPAPATVQQQPIPTPAPAASEREVIGPSARQRHQPEHQSKPWRLIAFLLGTVVITLAIFLAQAWSKPDVPTIQIVQVAPTLAAILQAPGHSSTPAWLVTVDSQGTVRLDPQVKTSLQANEAVQLWTRPADGQDSRSLGLIDPNQAVTIPAKLIGAVNAGQIFEMTLERTEGSASGKPDGPILFIGQMVIFGIQSSSKPLA